ncbi:cation:proton antiporter [Micromonospora sp. NPDC002717]|uniref:cation:proton antiporter n=1 Tax=Micromonospora sp. NPDC002717 TaxID=3154424 RepID=UPI0033233759
MPSNLALSLHFFLQLAVVLFTCWSVGLLLRRLGQPQVVADMVAGFLLGPTLLGLLLPALQGWLFPTTLHLDAGDAGSRIAHPSLIVLYVAGQLGLVLYMFVVGMSFRTDVLTGHLRSALGSSVAGVIAPIATGAVLGWVLASNRTFFDEKVAAWQAALFVGTAMAITAFPMLARIIHENNLGGSPTGTVALACAAVDDTVAWVLLAVVVSSAQGDASVALLALGGGLLYVLVVLTVGRTLSVRLARWAMDDDGLRPAGLITTMIILLLCAAYTEAVGIYAVVGAFLFGVAIPRGRFTEALRVCIEPVTVRLLLPTFFVYSGLATQFSVLTDPGVLLVLVIVVVVAFLSKGVACTIGARTAGLPWGAAASVGALMNARGLMELVLLNIGLEKGLVTPALYTVLALMTVITTLAATPLYYFIQRRSGSPAPPVSDGDVVAETEVDHATGAPREPSAQPR